MYYICAKGKAASEGPIAIRGVTALNLIVGLNVSLTLTEYWKK